MITHEFVERMRQEMIHVSPVILISFIIVILSTTITYLLERADEKEIEKRKYKRNLRLSTAAQTKVELEIKELTTR